MSKSTTKNSLSLIVFTLIFVAVAAVFIYLLVAGDNEDEVIVTSEPAIVVAERKPEIIEVESVEEQPQVVEAEIETEAEALPEPVVILPELNNSDAFINEKIVKLSWRKELLNLLLTDDIVRRVVVFTDNFARGDLAYTHMPLQPLAGSFKVLKINNIEQPELITNNNELFRFDQQNYNRYLQYIELLHSFEPSTLVEAFFATKPLFEQAYGELGYPDKDFQQVLQQALDRVLDLQVPVQQPLLNQPNVVYKYSNLQYEELSDADKLLLRLGKENLLQVKAIALEIDNQLKQQQQQQQQ
ncbi:DUF3014 domain-containing protein [Thalassotalea sp. ND16A]|uniref:DUF3014 domain-containing protein n=1 Tax=Thalassotalea sp. ND16A TaxID=1535422 RepID=UPI00051A4EC3|nr:DUF3014 domain-containing protein [Thalassotalea sp. ND16A]KGK00940.1 hypothetical protein ND16A_3142 [Thalassotalea sp. ND16A]